MELQFLVVVTGQACTLRCKDCGNLSPYNKNMADIYDMADIIRDMDALLKHLTVKLLQIQGGEAFMHPELGVLLKHAARNDRIEMCASRMLWKRAGIATERMADQRSNPRFN